MLLLYKQRTTWILVVVIQPYNRLLLVIYNIDMSHANKDNQDSESSQGTNFFYKTKPIGDRHFVRPRILVSLQLASWDWFSFHLTSQGRQYVNKSQLATCKLTCKLTKNIRTDKMPAWTSYFDISVYSGV